VISGLGAFRAHDLVPVRRAHFSRLFLRGLKVG
jgi:hypothetical protein